MVLEMSFSIALGTTLSLKLMRRFMVASEREEFTESQNHRMVGIGRDLCGSSSPNPLSKPGHLQQAAQDLVQAGLEYLQRRRLHNLPGQPVPVCSTLPAKASLRFLWQF